MIDCSQISDFPIATLIISVKRGVPKILKSNDLVEEIFPQGIPQKVLDAAVEADKNHKAVVLENSHIITHIPMKDSKVLVLVQDLSLEDLIKERTQQLEESNAALQSFVYAASHDLREPQNKVIAFGKKVQSSLPAEMAKEKQLVEVMVSAAQRGLNLIDSLLLYSRAGNTTEEIAEVDLNYIVDKVLEDLMITEQTPVIIDQRLPVLSGKEEGWRTVFQNLLSNALKFKSPDRLLEIHISYQLLDNKHIIRIQDNGIGFSQDKADKIFGLFFRLHSRSDYPGTGVGLALCRKIINQFGGSIRAMSTEGCGATFIIEI